jgi:hypothetical protein
LSDYKDILTAFSPITLKEMDGVKLMDRTDTKFTFKLSQLADILKEAEPFYRCLEIGKERISRYQTLYYDTGDFMLYNKHHSGALNRYKIRHRTYVESNLGYLEVKFKNNKGRTIKERIKQKTAEDNFNEDACKFLSSELPFNPKTLVPVVWINYGRITLVNRETAERVTIDLNLEFVNGSEKTLLDNLVIAEVKQEKRRASAFLVIMKKHHIREGSISKYCFAIAFTRDNVKKNNFKEKLFSLKHIINHDVITSSYRRNGN